MIERRSRKRKPKGPPLSAAALRAVERRGISRNGLRDLYHTLMTVPLVALLGLLAGSFCLINLVFAALYDIFGGLAGAGAPGFGRAFFFSVETLSTTGYGAIYPRSLAANLISALEIMLGLLGTALATGVLFARLSRPRSRVLFSRVAIVQEFRGTPTLMFRMVNERRNQIVEARVTLTVTQDEDDGAGGTLRRMISLKLERDSSPVFALSWLVMHKITPDSPLFGKSHTDIEARGNVLICSLTGIDDTLNTSIYARHVYGVEDIRLGHRFVDVIERTKTGLVAIDYRRFHDTVPE
jgi:inward rectifier potassium channel